MTAILSGNAEGVCVLPEAPAIEISPVMIEAGAAVLWTAFGGEFCGWGDASGRDLARSVYLAMCESRGSQ